MFEKHILKNSFDFLKSRNLAIRKGDSIQISWKITKTRTQLFKGICQKIKNNSIHPIIAIQYKISGETIIQTFPLSFKSFQKVEKLNI